MSKKRSLPHGRNAKRRPRERKARYLVVAGGAVTERQYFEEFLQNQYDNVVIKYQTQNLSPAQLAEWAVELWNDSGEESGVDSYQHAWVVVDVDNFTAANLQHAQRICKECDSVDLIISNPCFEVWLLNHIRQCPASFTAARDVEGAALKAGIVHGPGGKYVVIEAVQGKIDTAVQNALRQQRDAERERHRRELTGGYSPWTDMPQIIQYLDQQHQRSE